MRLLHTTCFAGDALTLVADKILAVSPATRHRSDIGTVEVTVISLQDATTEGVSYTVRETYDSIIKKLEAL